MKAKNNNVHDENDQQEEPQSQHQEQHQEGLPLLAPPPADLHRHNDEIQILDSDYKDVFLRRLASDTEQDGAPANDLRRRFGLRKSTLEQLVPEYKLLLSRPEMNLYHYTRDALAARYFHSRQIESEALQQSVAKDSSCENNLDLEPEDEAAAQEAALQQRVAHEQRWKEVQAQRLHKVGKSKLDSVMDWIRTEDRPVMAFYEGQTPLLSDGSVAEASAHEGDSVATATAATTTATRTTPTAESRTEESIGKP